MERKTNFARHLRTNMTGAETFLWSKIKNEQLGFRFRRQHTIGKYIVDFYCYECALVIEVDGGQHNDGPSDKTRDSVLKEQGLTVLRFWNNEVLENIEGVLHKITLSLHPSPEGRGKLKRKG